MHKHVIDLNAVERNRLKRSASRVASRHTSAMSAPLRPSLFGAQLGDIDR